jgi:hypothetical protein
MIKFKAYFRIIGFLLMFVFPSRSVLTVMGTGSKDYNQGVKTVISSITKANKHDHLDQEPQSTTTASETTAQNSVSADNRVFLPMIVSREMASPENLFYVSTSGSDSNPGTFSRPWRTIQKAANTLVAGQTVKILPGTYNAKFAPVNSGSAIGYITYTADPGTVILDGTGVPLPDDSKGDGLVQIQGKSYIRVQNLSLRSSSQNCVNISRNLAGTMRSSYIELTGLNIQNCNEAGILARSADHILIKDNIINHTYYSSGIGVWWSSDVTVDHNTITNARFYH